MTTHNHVIPQSGCRVCNTNILLDARIEGEMLHRIPSMQSFRTWKPLVAKREVNNS